MGAGDNQRISRSQRLLAGRFDGPSVARVSQLSVSLFIGTC
jgi:hypothetical protein